jgi:hypothetical protein
MNPNVFATFSTRMQHHHGVLGNHQNLKPFFISELCYSILQHHPMPYTQSFKFDLPFNGFNDNLFQLQGGGQFTIVESQFANDTKSIVQVFHVFEQAGALPRPQKYANLIDYMIRLKVLQSTPAYAGSELYLILVSDSVLINYREGIIFQNYNITPEFIAAQVPHFQNTILPASSNYLEHNPPVNSIFLNPPGLMTNPLGNLGCCAWQIN